MPSLGSAAVPRLPSSSPAAIDVLTCILCTGPIARVDIARASGLSQAAVTKAVAPLISAGFVTFDDVRRETGDAPGRPATPLRAVAEAVYAIGVKVTASDVFGVVVDFGASVVDSESRRLPRHTVGQVAKAVETVVDALTRRLGAGASRLVGVGVTVSGDVDAEAGRVRHSPLLGWRDVALAEQLASRLGRSVRVDNDVRALTVAEQWFGVGASGVDTFAIVTIGAGIGCGIYLHGEVVSGAFGVAGEIGHLPLADAGLACTCGRIDCVETVASSDAIVRAVREQTGREGLTIGEVAAMAHAGDAVALAAFDRAAAAIGTALAVVVNLTGPAVVVIEGEAVGDFELYDERLRSAFGHHAFGAAAQCRLELRTHDFDSWARGAAVTVLRDFVRNSAGR